MKFQTKLGNALLALCLAACAGSGGSSGGSTTVTPPNNTPPSNTPPPPPPPTVTADSFRTAEYNRMGGALDAVHAADAYALGYTGAGVIIGIVDFNFVLGSTEVNFNPASQGPNATALSLYTAQTGQSPPSDQHGQAVASAAAALKNDSGVHGIAFGAQILAVDYFSDVNESTVTQGGILYHVSDPWTYITSRGGRIINTSFGYESSDVIPNPPVVSEAYVVDSSAIAVDNGALLVASAGNGHGSNPSLSNYDILADMKSFGILNNAGAYVSGSGGFIIAGAVDNNGVIASFSDKAGTAMNYYMVAPGVNLTLPWNGSLTVVSGTSFSAPLISGAAAIVMQRWPSLTARQVMQILFDTATDLGAPGVDPVYGHGELNLQAALTPVGTTSFVSSTGGLSATSTTAISISPAFGDAPALRAAFSSMTMFDSFGRDFGIDLSQRMIASPGMPDLFTVMEQRLGWHGTGFSTGGATDFTYNVRANPEDGLVPFGSTGGLAASDVQHETMFRLTGTANGLNWSMGKGLALSDALDSEHAYDAFSNAALTRSFASAVGSAPSAFATIGLLLDDADRLTFGVSQAQDLGSTDHPRTPFHNGAQSAAMRLDRQDGDFKLGFELGTMVEEYGLLGSMAVGGLKMTDYGTTTWTTLTAQAGLSAHWSLRASVTGAATGAAAPGNSLIAGIGPIYSTSLSFGVAREDVFGEGDALTFTAGQPLRAERGSLMLASAAGRDSSGALIVAKTNVSLLPSGREFDLESGYRFPLGAWSGAANIAYSFDAGHVRGAQAAAALFWVSRRF